LEGLQILSICTTNHS